MKGLSVLFFLVLVGCIDDPLKDSKNDTGMVESDAGMLDSSSDKTDLGVDDGGVSGTAFGSVCNYKNNFSMGPECRSYFGNWDATTARADCVSVQGTLSTGSCETENLLGNCDVPANDGTVTWHLYGEAGGCMFAKLGCGFAKDGVYRPSDVCEDDMTPETKPFTPPVQICTEPLEGEPAGMSENGEVCTWQLISGSTEEGRKYEDYASCDVIRTQRPFRPYPRPNDAEREDTRLNDPTYKAELDWVKKQIQASACVCCHASTLTAPQGVSNWDIDQPGNFMNGFYDSGLALGANWITSESFGTFPPEDNNGFDRSISGVPSTNPLRMKAFFENELAFRGKSEADFETSKPFGGPLYDQLVYEPTACANGEGVDANGVITWSGTPARYIYVLESGSKNPTVAPNLDKPEGTLWRIDVAPEDEPLDSGSVTYGVVSGATQVIPESGEPTALTSGTEYYLYVTADVVVPVTRCLFTAP